GDWARYRDRTEAGISAAASAHTVYRGGGDLRAAIRVEASRHPERHNAARSAPRADRHPAALCRRRARLCRARARLEAAAAPAVVSAAALHRAQRDLRSELPGSLLCALWTVARTSD